MKKIILTLALAIAMSVPAFAVETTIGDWATLSGTNPDYAGTQAATANLVGKSANGIVYSRHNLSSYGEHYQATSSVVGTSTEMGIDPINVVTTEVCVFCHTPHFGRTDTAPIWNRGSSATGYVAYGPSIQGGQTIGGTTITFTASNGGSSLACLSCHDGVTTLDNLINKPGKGSNTLGAGADAGWIFGEVGTGDTIGDTANYGDTSNPLKSGSRLNIGAGNDNVRDAGQVTLANDHPINVVYNGGNVASLRPTTTTISSITMDNARLHGAEAAAAVGRSDNLWASRGFISNTATIGEILRDSKVACASCHDPHYKNQTNTDPAVICGYISDDPTTSPLNEKDDCYGGNSAAYITDVDSDGLFLRRVGGNSNSGVCRTCHNK